LQKSQDMRDGGRHFDFGHLIIGVDARASFRTRSLPLAGMGGTGLEISTWLGDLGGGAAMLAFTRGSAPSTPAITRFRGTDFGGSINLEGDVAGFVVGHTGGGSPSAAALGSGGLADAIAAYVADPIWPSRAERFENMYEPAGPGRVAALTDTFAAQIEAFAVWYLLQRLASKGAFSPAKIRLAATHVTGAARECATLFVEALERSRSTGGGKIEAAGPGPKPTPAGSPNRMLTLAALAADALD
jgi:hypothetical protein